MKWTMQRDLARQFYIAYVAYQQGVTFRTAEKNYGDLDPETLGPLWLLLADLTIEQMRHGPAPLQPDAPEQVQ